MDICIPKALPVVRAEKLSWMAGIASSFRCCSRELRHRKRRRDSDEGNLFSRIQKWVGDDLVCSISPQLSPSCQVQLSPKDSGVDLNSPSHRDDGNLGSSIMPDSRSEESERTVSLPKRRRSSSSDNLLKKDKMDLIKMTRESSKETRQPGAKSSKQVQRMETVSEMVTKKYTLVSNNTKAGPLVIKLRACPVESTQTTVDELEERAPRFDYVESPGLISSTVHNQLTPLSHDLVSSNDTSSRNRSSRLSSVDLSKSLPTVVSSTTRLRKELKKKTLPNPRVCVKLTADALAGKEKPDTAAVQTGTCLDVKHSKKSHFVDNHFTEKATGFPDSDHKEAHTRTFSPSAERAGEISKRYGRTRSSRESFVDEINSCANNLKANVSQESGLPVVSSSCAVTEREEFLSEKLPLAESPVALISSADDSSKDKRATGFLSEFTKFIKSTDQLAHASVSLRQGPGSYQVTRRHARIFRRSTLVPQLHRSLLLRKEVSRVQDLHRNLGVSVKQELVHLVEATSISMRSCEVSKSTGIKNDDISVDSLSHLESKINADDVLCDISSPDLLFEKENDNDDIPDLLSTSVLLYDAQVENEIMPGLLSATSLCEAQAGIGEIIPDELLFDLPSTSSFCKTNDACDLSILEEALCNVPSTSLLSESSFISDQMQLTKLRQSVFWLLKTLVPQLQLPSRFDVGGPAVDEMVEVVCEELDSSRKQSIRNEAVSSEFENACLNSLVDLCRSPHDCLARLRCKVLAMLSKLLGLDLDEQHDKDLLESMLDAVACANRHDDESPIDDIEPSVLGSPELFRTTDSDNERTFLPSEGEMPEEVSSVDSFSDIPELLVEPERKFVTSDLEDFLEPPKLTAVDER